LKISRYEDYALLFETLLKHEHPIPWCHHMRVILRDEPSVPALKPLAPKVGRVQEFAVDLGPAALQKAMEEEAASEELPIGERLQNAMLLAGMDFSNRRYADALAKYAILLKYHLAAKDNTMTALVLNGMGEVYDRMEKPREAKAHFESALTPALASEAKVVLLNVTLNLANLHLKHKFHAEAEIYYDAAANLAQAQVMPQVMIQALENRGVCQYQQGRVKEGVASWEQAEGLAKAVEEKDLRKKVLVRLQEHYRKAGLGERDRAVTRELQGIA
jgi:tetratricopeptide (TPR) repeat protein